MLYERFSVISEQTPLFGAMFWLLSIEFRNVRDPTEPATPIYLFSQQLKFKLVKEITS